MLPSSTPEPFPSISTISSPIPSPFPLTTPTDLTPTFPGTPSATYPRPSPTPPGPECPNGCDLDLSLLPALPSLPSSANDLQSPITSGTVYQHTFTYIFYASTVVGVDGHILDPRSGFLSGLLPGGQVAALLCDGLHLGAAMVVPYPPAWAAAVEQLGIRLPVSIGAPAIYVPN